MLQRAGTQTGEGEYALVKATPDLQRRSIAGVLMIELPKAAIVSKRC